MSKNLFLSDLKRIFFELRQLEAISIRNQFKMT